jgi:hypothetical protein
MTTCEHKPTHTCEYTFLYMFNYMTIKHEKLSVNNFEGLCMVIVRLLNIQIIALRSKSNSVLRWPFDEQHLGEKKRARIKKIKMAALTFLSKYSPKTLALISSIVIVFASILGFYLFPMFIKSNLDVSMRFECVYVK